MNADFLPFRQHRRAWWAVAVLGLGLLLAACSDAQPGLRTSGGESRQAGEGNPIPTPIPGEEVGEEPQSAARDTPEGTWEGYLRDMIAFRVAELHNKIRLLERYENPDHTAQNLGGLAQDITLLEDRTSWNIRGNSASSLVEFDVRVTYANGDTDTRTCEFEVYMEYNEEDGVWYVLSPRGLANEVYCAP